MRAGGAGAVPPPASPCIIADRSRAHPRFTIVDAGANFGWYTTLFSRLTVPGGQVHAFEPMPPTADVLERNCHLNRCENVTINRCALGERADRGPSSRESASTRNLVAQLRMRSRP